MNLEKRKANKMTFNLSLVCESNFFFTNNGSTAQDLLFSNFLKKHEDRHDVIPAVTRDHQLV